VAKDIIKFVIGLTIAGFANFRSFAEMPSRRLLFLNLLYLFALIQNHFQFHEILI
jgi:hypothetical protein